MRSPVFASRDLLAALDSSGLPGGWLQSVTIDEAILVLGATDEAGGSIVEPRQPPVWALGGDPSVIPWRSAPTNGLERWRENGYRNLEGVDLGVGVSEEAPTSRICVLFKGVASLAVIVDNTDSVRRVQGPLLTREPEQRSQSERDAELASRLVVLIGAGSLGSHLARSLSEWGVGFTLVVDKDWLEAPNLALHTCDPSWVGAEKAKAAVGDLVERLGGTRALGWRFDVLENSALTRDLISKADLVVVAVDDAAVRAFVNHTAVQLGVPAVFSALYRGGTIGESLLVRPGGPCLNCSRRVLPITSDTEREVTPSAYRSGLLTSIYGLASLTTGMIMSAMAPRLRTVGPLQSQLALWSPIAQDDIDEPYKFLLPHQVNWVPLPKVRSCAVCRGGNMNVSGDDRDRMRQRLGIAV